MDVFESVDAAVGRCSRMGIGIGIGRGEGIASRAAEERPVTGMDCQYMNEMRYDGELGGV